MQIVLTPKLSLSLSLCMHTHTQYKDKSLQTKQNQAKNENENVKYPFFFLNSNRNPLLYFTTTSTTITKHLQWNQKTKTEREIKRATDSKIKCFTKNPFHNKPKQQKQLGKLHHLALSLTLSFTLCVTFLEQKLNNFNPSMFATNKPKSMIKTSYVCKEKNECFLWVFFCCFFFVVLFLYCIV